jgi:hypothetical protein
MISHKFFIGTLVTIGIILICLSIVVQGAITFTQSPTAGITVAVTGIQNKNFLTNVSTAENSTNANLDTRAGRTTVDAVNDTFSYKIRMVDRKGMHDSDFYMKVYAFTATTVNVVFPVIWFNGTTGLINISVSAIGVYNIPPVGTVVSNCTSSKITKWVGAGAISYWVNQSFYGCVWNITNAASTGTRASVTKSNFLMETSGFNIGGTTGTSYTNITLSNQSLCFFDNKNIFLNPTITPIILNRYVNFYVKNSSVSCMVSTMTTNGLISFAQSTVLSTMYIDNSSFLNYRQVASSGRISSLATNNNNVLRITNSNFYSMSFSGGLTLYLKNVIISNGHEYAFYNCKIASADNVVVNKCPDAVSIYQNSFNMTNCSFTKCNYLFWFYSPAAQIVHMINCKTDTYTTRTSVSGFTTGYCAWDKTVKITVRNTTSLLSGVSVKWYNRTGVLKGSYTTDASGYCSGILPDRIWKDTPTIHVYLSSPYNVVISKSGYQTINMSISLSDSQNLTVCLLKNSSIVLHENIVDAVGTHEFSFNSLLNLFSVWANYTGIPGSSSTLLSIINPNPGNGTHSTNYLKKDSGGLTASVDTSMKNFTVLNEINIGTGNIYEYYEGNTSYTTIYGTNWRAQTFTVGTIGTNENFTLNKIKLVMFRNNNPGILTCSIRETDTVDPIGNDISTGAIDADMFTDLTDGSNYTINMTPVVLYKNQMYAFILRANSGDINNYVGIRYRNLLSSYSGGQWMSNSFSGVGLWYKTGLQDCKFYIYGWSLGVNISWNHCLNLSFLWNGTDGITWTPFANHTAVSNGTITVPFPGASGVGSYWWKVEAESNHTNYLNTSVFMFETVNTTSGSIFLPRISRNDLVLGLSGGTLMAFSVGVVIISRLRKKNEEEE